LPDVALLPAKNLPEWLRPLRSALSSTRGTLDMARRQTSRPKECKRMDGV